MLKMLRKNSFLSGIFLLVLILLACFSLGAYGNSDAPSAWQKALKSAQNDPVPETLKEIVHASRTRGEESEKAISVAIYIAGNLSMGRFKTAQKAYPILKNLDNSGSYVDALSINRLSKTCSSCNGSGYIEQACEKCGGSGNCPFCEGNGQRIIDGIGGKRIITCMECNGSGKCPQCEGTGKVEAVCPACRGRGTIISKRRASEICSTLIDEAMDMTDINSAGHERTTSHNFHQAKVCDPTKKEATRHTSSIQSESPQTVDRTNPARTSYFLKDAVRDCVGVCVNKLEKESISRVAVTRIYFNGSGTDAVAKHIQRNMLAQLLMDAPSTFVIMDRFDMQLTAKENRLHWMLNGKGKDGAGESEAILMGELLWKEPFAQAILSLRLIDTETGQLISAPAKVFDLDEDFAQRLGRSSFESSSPPIFTPREPLSDTLENVVTRLLKPPQHSVAFSENLQVPEKYGFAYRVAYALLADELVRNNVNLLERELLHQVAEEHKIADSEINTILEGDAVISVEVDETTKPETPGFFLRAVSTEEGQLLGMTHIDLGSNGKPVAAAPHAGTSTIGTDDSLDEAVSALQQSARPRKKDLLFSSSIRLDREMKLRERDIALYPGEQYINFFRVKTSRRGNRFFLGRRNWRQNEHASVDGYQAMEAAIEKLVSVEQGDLSSIKADLTMLLLVGFCVETKEDKMMFPGPLNTLYREIAGKVTIRRNQSSCDSFWRECMIDATKYMERSSSLANALLKSLHPEKRKELLSEGEKPVDPVKGFFVFDPHGRDPSAKFNYEVEIKWDGKYPTEAKVTIDLSPMQRSLYKVKQ